MEVPSSPIPNPDCDYCKAALSMMEVMRYTDGKALKKIRELATENKQLKEDIAEKQSLFDLQHTRTLEASAAWQAEAGKDCFPDLGELIRWLMEKAKLS